MKRGSAGLAQLPEVANWLLEQSRFRILLLEGDMGAGKTTLIKEICRQLGVEDEVSSPTFSLVNEYESADGPVYHFDFYRLEEEEEAYDFGVEEYLDSGHWCLLEWPEKIRNLIPSQSALIRISVENGLRHYEINQPQHE